jgi:hypothetical protein
MFRPSDDATVFPFLIPSNFFAVTSACARPPTCSKPIRVTTETPAAECLRPGRRSGGKPCANTRWWSPLGFGHIYAVRSGCLRQLSIALTTATFPACFRCRISAPLKPEDPLYRHTHGDIVLSSRQPLLLSRAPPPKARRRPARGHGHVSGPWDIIVHARPDQRMTTRKLPRLPGNPAAKPTPAPDSCTKSFNNNNPNEVHPVLVRLGQHHFRRADPENISRTAAFAGLTMADKSF